MLRASLYNKNPLLVMSYITQYQGQSVEMTASKISKKLGLSIGSVYSILKEFSEAGLILGTKIGRATIYETRKRHPIIKQFRIFDNLLIYAGLIQQLKEYTRKIILFGSCARGEDDSESDIDIFLLVDEDLQPQTREIIAAYESDREIRPVIVDSLELLEMQSQDKIFYEEINKGIVLWEGED